MCVDQCVIQFRLLSYCEAVVKLGVALLVFCSLFSCCRQGAISHSHGMWGGVVIVSFNVLTG